MTALKISVVVPFLNEEEHLARLLASIEQQTQRPERLVLVDDGSTDGSPGIAESVAAAHDWVSVLRLRRRPSFPDRLAFAAEYAAFSEGLAKAGNFDAVGKLDADLELPPDFLATLGGELERDKRLGIVGAYLSVVGSNGQLERERHPAYHVRGATKFYRRECLEEIQPLEPMLGWDTIDEATARMRGWNTRSVEIPGGDPLHLRRTGSLDGVVRGYSRWGRCAYAAGYHPLWVALGALKRMPQKPRLIGGTAYVSGWVNARRQRTPRAPAEVRHHVSREQMGRLRSALKGALRPGWDTSDFFPSLDHDLERYGHLLTGRVLNAGAGERDISDVVAGTVVNQEIPHGRHPGHIDIWAPLEEIPREDGHFDSIVCNAVLEHVSDPERVMSELARVIKPDGLMYLSVPFMQPEHKDPIDGQRYTLDGLRALCDRHGFDVVESGPIHSVEATVGWVLTNWLRGENRLRVLLPGRVVHSWLRRKAARSERQVPSIASAHFALARRRAT